MTDDQHQPQWPAEPPLEGDPALSAGGLPGQEVVPGAPFAPLAPSMPDASVGLDFDPTIAPALDPLLGAPPISPAMGAGAAPALDPARGPEDAIGAQTQGDPSLGTIPLASPAPFDAPFGAGCPAPTDPGFGLAAEGGTPDLAVDPAIGGGIPGIDPALGGAPLANPWGPGIPPLLGPMPPQQPASSWLAETPQLLPGTVGSVPTYPPASFPYQGPPGMGGPPFGPSAPWAPPAQAPRKPKLTSDSLPSIFPEKDAPDPDSSCGPDHAEPEDDWMEDTGPDPLIQLPSKLQGVIVEVAMVGLVVSIIAFAAAWLPDFSMLATIIAIISMPFGIVALIGTLKKGSRGRWMPIASLALSVLAIVIAIFTQTFAAPEVDVAAEVAAERASLAQSPASSSSADRALGGLSASSSASSSAANREQITAWSSAAPHVDSTQGVIVDDATDDTEDWAVGNNLTNLPIGTPAEYATDLAVSVDTVTPGLVNYDGTAITCITVVYTNLSTTAQTYHQYDWTAQSSSGNDVSPCYYTSAQSELGTNEIAPGTTVSGNIYFQGKLSRVIFTPTGPGITSQEISWLVK